MSVEKKSRHSFLFSKTKSNFIKGVYYHEKHSKCNQNFTKEVLP